MTSEVAVIPANIVTWTPMGSATELQNQLATSQPQGSPGPNA